MASTQDQINSLRAAYSSNTARIAELTKAEQEWRAQSQVTCNQSLPARRQECEADKVYKRSMADQYKAQIAGLNAENVNIQKQIDALLARQKAEDEAMKELASQGKSLDALAIEAQGTANAQQIKASAEADATRSTAESTNDGKKTLLYVGLGIGALILIIVCYLLYKKYKKSKKA